MSKSALLAAAVVGLMASFQQPVAAGDIEDAQAAESAVSSPPMEMDDPGTPGSQGLEVNLVGTLSRAGQGRGSETLLDANYGIGDRIQIKFERPYLTHSVPGAPLQKGVGATALGVKWRFTDRAGLEMAAYPQYRFDDGFALMDDEGHPEEEAGRSIYLPLLVSKRVSDVYTLSANIGYMRNLENRGDDLDAAFGAGRSLGGAARVLAEVFSERDRSLKNRQTDVRVGCAGTLLPSRLARSKFALDGFASIGHSIGATEDGEASTSFTFGLSVLKKPRDP